MVARDKERSVDLGRRGAGGASHTVLGRHIRLLSHPVTGYLLVLLAVVSCSIEDHKTGTKTEPAEVIEYRLSPDPAFLRVGQPLNLAITKKDTFDYLSADDCTWDENSGGSVVRFLSAGVVEGVSTGSASITFKRKSGTGQYQYPSIQAVVLPPKSLTSVPDREVVAAYYPWFSERHYKKPENWSIFLPVIKPYDPQSAVVAEQHIRMAKDANIDAFAVSWISSKRFNQPGDGYLEIIAPCMNALISVGKRLGFKVHVLYETPMNLCPWTESSTWLPLKTDEERQAAIATAKSDFALLANQLSVLDETITFFVYQAEGSGLRSSDWRQVFEATRQLPARTSFCGDFSNPEYLDAFDGAFSYGACFSEAAMFNYANWAAGVKSAGMNKRVYVTAGPGFDSRKFWGPHPVLVDRQDGGYYQHTWNQVLASGADGVFITSWNEWGESTIIEPSREYGYKYLDITADYANVFKGR